VHAVYLARQQEYSREGPEPSSRKRYSFFIRDNDPQFLPRLKEKEKAMLGLWMSVVYAGTLPDMEEAWRKFQG